MIACPAEIPNLDGDTLYVSQGDLGQLNVLPVMYQGGTRDLGITPVVKRPKGAYEQSSGPKYFVEFDGAGHFAWTDLNKTYQDVISRYSVAFFDRHLKRTGVLNALAELTTGTRFPKQVSSVRAEMK